MTVAIATSPGRSGFGPQLSLSYDSGAGNSPFGFGWSVPLPAITRKTDKGLPWYLDEEESDVFILSGAEDLVPEFEKDADGNWVLRDGKPVVHEQQRTVNIDSTSHTYLVRRYRPRIEGLFARIERWTRLDGDVHWRSISRDNTLSIYGKDGNSRIADPRDGTRIFSWLICETRDDKGNAVVYEYKPEDATRVDLTRPHERNRGAPDDKRRSTNRYPKRIRYGNRRSLLDETGSRPQLLSHQQSAAAGWMFEVVFDYGDHDTTVPTPHDDQAKTAAGEPAYPCPQRQDPFSNYRAGFEVRTNRLCQRLLMFHHFPDEADVGADCLVRSVDLEYSHDEDPDGSQKPIYSMLLSIVQTGYQRAAAGGYVAKSMPPLEFSYTEPIVQDAVEEVDPSSLENLPLGLDGTAYRWIDLHGEGLPGILSEQAGAWFYKRNVSPVPVKREGGRDGINAAFGPIETVAMKPALVPGTDAQVMDLAGDGQPDVVIFDGPTPGLYEHDDAEGWQRFRPFKSRLTRNFRDPSLRFIDIDGDGRADVLVSEDDAFVWHASLGEDGFGPARRVAQAIDEEQGPHLVFAEATQSIYLADLSGDGLTDLVRIRNGEICYWPNLGYGRFGAKVTMDNAPYFDSLNDFNPVRIRLADIDGGGTTDIIYLHQDGPRLYFNQSGNGWSAAQPLTAFPRIDDVVSVMPVDLLGSGTACLVWSSPLRGDAPRQMRFVNVMGRQKPHLLVRIVNNLGAETVVQYAPSTKFYLQDKQDGRPWITRLPFPVHVVERVEVMDHISHNRFVTRYTYHHGYFDGDEREFRGFGMVEQMDTEELAAITGSAATPQPDERDAATDGPPVLTRTWSHTGAYITGRVSDLFAGSSDPSGKGEYYREPGLSNDEARDLLLDDTILPLGLTPDERREAVRALKGAMLRQEVYAHDGTDRQPHPYAVTEQNLAVRRVQPRAGNRHAVFLSHPRECVTYHYERNPTDPRVTHTLTLDVDSYGNVLRSAAVAYGRRRPDLDLEPRDRDAQAAIHITCAENDVTNAIDMPDAYRTPHPCDTRSYELTGLGVPTTAELFTFDDMHAAVRDSVPIDYEQRPTPGVLQKRLFEQVRTLFRRDDLSGALPLGELSALALTFEIYKLAFTPGLVAAVYGTRVNDSMLTDEGHYVHSEGDDRWWIPAGRVFFSADELDDAAVELDAARRHFFLPRRYQDPFGQSSTVDYDRYDLLVAQTRDALLNTVTAGERDAAGQLVGEGNDYRVLVPRIVTDPNGNRCAASFDTLGMMVATAVMGKRDDVPRRGDLLEEFDADLPNADIANHLEDPFTDPHLLLGRATTRMVYDVFAYARTRDDVQPTPGVVYTLARETHDADVGSGGPARIQHSFSYYDGFGRAIQKKAQAEPGPVVDGGPAVARRWVGSGWTVYNNKGSPVRQFEPYFSATHVFEFDARNGVSSVRFYDPLGRAVATLHPNHTWEKVVVDPWRQESWDVNDTVLVDHPGDDPDVGPLLRRLPDAQYLPTWHAQRASGALGADEQDAAQKTAMHASTPAVTHADSLGRGFLTVAHNKFVRNSALLDEKYATRVVLDIEGKPREVLDALDRVVMRYDYDITGTRLHQASMEAGQRWTLHDATGSPIYVWDSRDHRFRTVYDELRRPVDAYVADGATAEILVSHTDYGESEPDPEAHNLRGKVVALSDQTGVVRSSDYDFKGNLLRGSRRLATVYTSTLDLSANPNLEPETFASSTTFDALNRPVTLTSPDGSVYRPTFNEANLLESVTVDVRGATASTTFVANIDYDARGKRVLIEHGNGARTTYAYDPLTLRLITLTTMRATAPTVLQELRYTYDPSGNLTRIADAAQQTVYFNNSVVTAGNDYTYDAVYRLIDAAGREHIGQQSQPQTSWDDQFRANLPAPTDGQAMRRYTEQYDYDPVGNFLRTIHQAPQGNWTRSYSYTETGDLEPGSTSNRLSSTAVGAHPVEPYTHDEHGNMASMPHLTVMRYDYRDKLQSSSREFVAAGTPETTYYVYDATGQRTRKVTERRNGTRKKERIYLGGFEVFREYDASGTGVTLERETVHVMDDKQRVALVETRTRGSEPGVPEQLVRYQFTNHLASVLLELDDVAQVISYEEYYPYGSTSYQAVSKAIEVSAKRYRYTGMERDEESGFGYHGARYYVPWLGRWNSFEPAAFTGESSSVNLFVYAVCNPVLYGDTDGLQPVRVHGTTAHAEVLPKIEDRINELQSYYSAETPVKTLLPGSTVKRRGRNPWGVGEIDLVIFSTSGGRHVYDLKPKYTSMEARYLTQITDYVYKLDVVTAAKIGTVLEGIYRDHPAVLAPVLIDKGNKFRVYELSLPVDPLTQEVLPGFIEYTAYEYTKKASQSAEEAYDALLKANPALAPSPVISRIFEPAPEHVDTTAYDREQFFYTAVDREMAANKYAGYDLSNSRYREEIDRRNEQALRTLQGQGRSYDREMFIGVGGIPLTGGWGNAQVRYLTDPQAGAGSAPAYVPHPTGAPGFWPGGFKQGPAPNWSPQPLTAPVPSPSEPAPSPGFGLKWAF